MKRFFTAILLWLPFAGMSQQKTPDAFRQKAMVLKTFFEKNHYKPLQWNDSSSVMLYNKWLDELDDEKLFLTQKDIAVLEKYKTSLDEEMTGKSWEFFTTSVNLYRLRLQQADSSVQSFLSKPMDFSKAETITWPFNNYAANEQEISKRWQGFLKWRLLSNIADRIKVPDTPLSTTLPGNFAKLELAQRERLKRREHGYIKSKMQMPAEYLRDLQDEYLNTIAWCYDPHSNYMNFREQEEFSAAVSAREFSAGLSINENEKGDKTIDFLQPGGSAWKSGQLHKGDVLVKLKKGNVEKDADDITPEEIAESLSGTNSADVEVTVRTAAGETKTVKLAQEKISAEDGIVKSYVIKSTKNFGYINLPGFYSREEDPENIKYDGCANDISKEIIKLKKDNIAGLILDLRNNGGGSMWEAMQLAGIFIDAGPVASMKDKDGKVTFLKDPNRGTIYDGPMLVLINGASASASEFLSATLQDYNRAIIVGGTTYGKGTAQEVLAMDTNKVVTGKNYEDYVKVTGDKFYRVNGSTVQWKGVEPDVPLPDVYADISFKEKNNVSALVPDMSRKGNYQTGAAFPLDELRTKSAARVRSNEYFTAIDKFAAYISDYKKGTTVVLQWPDYARRFNSRIDTFEFLEKGEEKTAIINADNNAFDKERISLSGKQGTDMNEAYLKNIRSSNEIAEACNILEDLIK